MARFYGAVGYAISGEIRPGVWGNTHEVRQYYGDILKVASRWQGTEYVNDDITVSNRVSIVADAFAFENFAHIRYVEWMGARWSVVSVEVARPRLILTLGGVYNGAQTESA